MADPKVQSETSEAPVSKRRGKFVLSALVLLMVLGAVWGKTAWVNFCQWQAEKKLSDRQTDRALEWITRAYQADAQNPRTLLIQSRVHRRNSQIEAAVADLTRLHQLTGTTDDLQREQWLVEAQVGDLQNLERNLADMLIDPRGRAADICETYVNSCMLNYRFNDAKRMLEVWQADFPQDPLPHYYRGRILEHQGGWDQAVAEFETALNLDSEHIPSAYNLARVKLAQNQVEAALKNYRICTNLQPDHAAALVGTAVCLRMQQDVETARQKLEQARQLPDAQVVKDFRSVGDPVYVARSAILLEQGQLELAAGNYDQAVTHLKEALQRNPKDRKARLALANALRGQGKLDAAQEQLKIVEETQEAIKRLDECFDQLQLDLNNADLRAEIGAIFLKYISEDQGVVWLKNALYYDPENQLAKQTLSEYYEKQQIPPDQSSIQ
ncbi:tetratricopeptide repeat protein [Gimesia panareensis]|uniref:Tetratricopeptide repeat protein n=1 Tax=Gimesia panareensis TaxID=2527978 RepID=A0A518FTR5_9PLAN|nr:tetratricopeptide repeat protein [Gimesia panareensis]QDV19733.1 tetratricopeptide repeat protein [Gimesia panareensis]